MFIDPMPGTTAAGGFSRVTNRGGVADLFSSPAEYGASLAAFNTWKRYGIATSQQQQSTTFGCVSQYGLSSRNGKKLAALDPRHTGRNPVSWEGADLNERPDEHNRSVHGAAQPLPEAPGVPPGGGAGDNMSASGVWAAAQAGPPKSVQLKEEQMQQTWAELMRNGAVNKPSAAMALVVRAARGSLAPSLSHCPTCLRSVRPLAAALDGSHPVPRAAAPTAPTQDQTYLPKEYSANLMGEGAAKGNPLGSSMHTIGLGGQGGNFNHNKVSSKFTSQFHDPYL